VALRLLADTAGIALVLAAIVGAIQCLEWGLDPVEPDEVDSFELPNSVEARVQGAGVRARRARTLAAELELERCGALEPEPAR
jgi:hypothetical protein